MRNRLLSVALGAVALFAVAVPAIALQCVPYARSESEISIQGDAWTWWSAAAGTYDRGSAPSVGAVLVFERHGRMQLGHVAVVSRIVNSREVLVDQANWANGGRVSTRVAVRDVSPRNDWTDVRVWNTGIEDYGTSVYPTYGFIYPRSPRIHLQTVPAVFQPSFGKSGHATKPAHHTATVKHGKTAKAPIHNVAGHNVAVHSVAIHQTTPSQSTTKHAVTVKEAAKPAVAAATHHQNRVETSHVRPAQHSVVKPTIVKTVTHSKNEPVKSHAVTAKASAGKGGHSQNLTAAINSGREPS